MHRFWWWPVVVLLLGVAGCTWTGPFAPEPGPTPQAQEVAFLEVNALPRVWGCDAPVLTVQARVRVGAAVLSGGDLWYRHGESETWQMVPMQVAMQQGDNVVFAAALSRAQLPPEVAALTYRIVVRGQDGREIVWPDLGGGYASLPVVPCQPSQAETPMAEAPTTPGPAPASATLKPPTAFPTEGTPGFGVTVLPTPTEVVLILPTATPTSLPVADASIYSQGQVEAVQEWNFFDLDSGGLYTSCNLNTDFQLYPGDDPYLDQIRPFNNAYFGWFGSGEPTKARPQGGPPTKDECLILMAKTPLTIEWPEFKDTYFCYRTSEGRYGWLRVDVWVSLPLSERRLMFTWRTYK